MELTSNFKAIETKTNSSPLNSPTSNPSPIPITRSDPNSPYPTTFVTADTSSFKQVVQMLTGSSEKPVNKTHQQINHQQQQQQQNENNNSSSSSKNFVIPPIKTAPKKQQGFKLFERRNSIKNLISPLTHSSHINNFQNASFKPEILSPSILDFPSLTLSPVTPLVEDPFNKSSPSIHNGNVVSSSFEEDKVIAEKGFYLHQSPISTPRDSEPQLLPLFPLSSPRVSDP